MDLMAENQVLVGEEEDKENSPASLTAAYERPICHPVLMRNRFFEKRNENVPDDVYRSLF